MSNEYVIKNGELYHYGVPGMKWGRKKGRTVHEDYKRAHSNKKLREMSDDELKKTNNRLQQEVTYKQLKKQTNAGQKAVKAFIAGAATITAIAGAAAVYKKYGGPLLKKIGKTKVAQLAWDKAGDLAVKKTKIGVLGGSWTSGPRISKTVTDKAIKISLGKKS